MNGIKNPKDDAKTQQADAWLAVASLMQSLCGGSFCQGNETGRAGALRTIREWHERAQRVLTIHSTESGHPLQLNIDALIAAWRTVRSLGYSYEGGEQWKPPLGMTPDVSRALDKHVEAMERVLEDLVLESRHDGLHLRIRHDDSETTVGVWQPTTRFGELLINWFGRKQAALHGVQPNRVYTMTTVHADGREEGPTAPGEGPHPKVEAIPHAYLIRAALDGDIIQLKDDGGEWTTLGPAYAIAAMASRPNSEFRIKPQPLVRWCAVYPKHGVIGSTYSDREAAEATIWSGESPESIRRLEIDPDTMEVITSTTEPA